jgi:hypothetical protein
VDERTGAHRYIRHSHDPTRLVQALMAQGQTEEHARAAASALFCGPGYEISDLAEQLVGDLAMVWTGQPGSAILADTYGLHMGIPLVEGERLMLWVRYGLGVLPDNDFGEDVGAHAAIVRPRIPATARARYVNRLLLGE